ncbi:MAG: hypothetical protein DHS20C18_13410 [Saprospiraceae bacterium]|nr:MAG: hypothetical protein DHS20C18_13410 [Saprospiraceae bacterium]
MKELRILFIALLLTSLAWSTAIAQCETWINSPRKDEAENAHVVYRPFLKDKEAADLNKMSKENFKIAFDNWKKAYDLAPAADGNRPSHYVDGRTLYQAMYNTAPDDAKKKEYAEMILKLYDQQVQCYKNEAYLVGRKGYDMFYYLGYGYTKPTYETLKKAVELGGNDTEYIVFDPLAQVMAYLYKSKQLGKPEFIELHEKMDLIMEHNIQNNKKFSSYYEDTKAIVRNHFREVENDVFDCEYFKEKLVPHYRNAPDSLEVIKYVYNKLKAQGCDSTSAIMVELSTKYEKLATEINIELEKVRRKNNPCYDATQLQKEGSYAEAMARYEDCLKSTDDPEAKAQVYYSMAFIQTWQLGQLGNARSNANKAASLKSGWGKPYILIGDIYAKMSRGSCDDWNKRLAIIAATDKYYHARNIDSDVSDEANKRIANFAGSLPEKQDGFMRDVKEGDTVTVGCGIGETVKVRFN